MSSKLFTPVNVGAVSLANRVIMAPLTRMRSRDDTDVPVLPLMADYYRQRANAASLVVCSILAPTPHAVLEKIAPRVPRPTTESL